jgi:hypothetical protein
MYVEKEIRNPMMRYGEKDCQEWARHRREDAS